MNFVWGFLDVAKNFVGNSEKIGQDSVKRNTIVYGAYFFILN